MDKEKILKAIAPCALCCYTCPSMKDGVIAQTAQKLHHYFDGFCEFNQMMLPERWRQREADFQAFDDKLVKYSKRHCNGCRDNTHGQCCIEGCFILECTSSHGVEFCAECAEFPCNKLKSDIFHPVVIAEWKEGNERIREVGIEQFYEEITSRSHYLPFKDKGNQT